ncbi:hypothetical protein D3C83_174970 [compost metagenome]
MFRQLGDAAAKSMRSERCFPAVSPVEMARTLELESQIQSNAPSASLMVTPAQLANGSSNARSSPA